MCDLGWLRKGFISINWCSWPRELAHVNDTFEDSVKAGANVNMLNDGKAALGPFERVSPEQVMNFSGFQTVNSSPLSCGIRRKRRHTVPYCRPRN